MSILTAICDFQPAGQVTQHSHSSQDEGGVISRGFTLPSTPSVCKPRAKMATKQGPNARGLGQEEAGGRWGGREDVCPCPWRWKGQEGWRAMALPS